MLKKTEEPAMRQAASRKQTLAKSAPVMTTTVTTLCLDFVAFRIQSFEKFYFSFEFDFKKKENLFTCAYFSTLTTQNFAQLSLKNLIR